MSPPRPGRSLMPPGREAALVADSGFAALVPLASLRPSRRHPHHPPASRRGAPRSGAAALAGHQRPPPHQVRAPVRSGRRGHAIDPRLATAVRRQGWLPVLPNLGAGALPWTGSSRKPCYAPAREPARIVRWSVQRWQVDAERRSAPLPGGAGPLRRRGAAAVVGPSHRTNHAWPARGVLFLRSAGEQVRPRRAAARNSKRHTASDNAPQAGDNPRRRPPPPVARTGFARIEALGQRR